MTTATTAIVPPPWRLKGRGFMFLYHINKDWGSTPQALPVEGPPGGDPARDAAAFCGGLAALMLVDYQESAVGPYRELLFIPGRFLFQGQRWHAISRIWVDSPTSVASGRANWGIPKELGQFTIQRSTPGVETWSVEQNGKVFFRATMRFGGLPLPVHTRLLPMPLLQWRQGQGYLTRFRGHGWGKIARLQDLSVDGAIFPAISNLKPLIGLAVDPFNLTFPLPQLATDMVEAPAACCKI